MHDVNDELVFVEDDGPWSDKDGAACPWRILVVDDDPGVHEATRFALANIIILDRPLALFHASSGAEAVALLRVTEKIAVVLLDVVMESDDAGLRMVDIIRNELKLANCRIILRTGQPGQAPEAETITRYDINDYKTKSELTQNRLFLTLTTAIRSYDQLLRLDATRRGLEKIVAASNQFIAEQGLQSFADGVITQIAGLLGVEPEGLVCCAAAQDSPLVNGRREFHIIAAAGHFRALIQRRLCEIDDPRILGQLMMALKERRSLIEPNNITLYFAKTPAEGFAAFIDSARPISEVDQELLKVFCTNIALCAKNIELVTKLRRDAFFDRQLGLPNRTALVCELDQTMTKQESGCALAIVDIDQFAVANDLLGHDYGDALLKATAQRLGEHLPANVFIARLGGDAFAVMGPKISVNGETIQACFQTPFVIEGVHQPVSACVGITLLESGLRSGIEYIRDSYLALKQAKTAGLGQTVLFSQELGSAVRERAHLLRDLRLSFEQQQLFLTYQPQIELSSGRIIGVEALMRWRREDGALVPPESFIPIAEQSGLIVDMGRWLLQTALQALQRFRVVGCTDLRMAVNISPVQLRQPGFIESVSEALHLTRSRPADLELEITESVAVGGLEPVIALLKRLRAMGVTVAIDDFGTGYSSLAYLDKLPADRLKLDRSFVRALERDDNGTRIARMIVVLGRELGLQVIAEGVENQKLEELVMALGCNETQGYHYGHPMQESEFIAWHARYKGKQA
ncbi:EAL domain-containing protein [Accumulibacter sp.]|uniref:two-component system response regulator n=1 Tax=Accumulibacter sp. TaxID=2053492 RepID=UPI001A43007F|nr:EAL domain-containing protein [Accumulibacter sp.]MBL8400441.1 EAL domain-containing protein [Accumulibacter sp.]